MVTLVYMLVVRSLENSNPVLAKMAALWIAAVVLGLVVCFSTRRDSTNRTSAAVISMPYCWS